MSDERKLPTKEELTEWRIKYGRYLDSRFSRMIGKLLFAAEERERLQAAIMRRGRGCAVGITGDPEDAEGLGLNEALLAIDECIRFGREAHNERVRLQAEVERLRPHDYLLSWRGIEAPCPACGGSGWRAYADTATWRGGIGGQAITDGVCDSCWGSGDALRPWADQRKLSGLATKLAEFEAERDHDRLIYLHRAQVAEDRLAKIEELAQRLCKARVFDECSPDVVALLDFILRPTGDTP